MKNKILKILIIVVPIILILLCIIGTIYKSYLTDKNYKPYSDVVLKLKNNESFFVYLYDSGSKKEDIDKMIKYYKDTYNIKYISFNKAKCSLDLFNKFRNIAKFDDNENESEYFIYFNKGNITRLLLNSESEFKNFMIDEKIIDSKYKNIDYLADDTDIDKYFNTNSKKMIILLKNNENVYKYRKILYKNDIDSYVIYLYRLANDISFEKMLRLNKKINIPSIVWLKNGKIIDYVDGIDLNNFESKLKSSVRKNSF